MDGKSVVVEGQACNYVDDGNFDPDISLSYMDDKIQNYLGHFQKDFEGGVSAENLGSRYGGYGSFLPTYERSSSVWSQPETPHRPKTLQGNPSTSRSPDDLPKEGASQSSTVLANGSPMKLGQSLHESRVSFGDGSFKKVPCLSSARVTENYGTLNKSGNIIGQRTLKVRIKMGSENTMTQNNAIYSGLGLEDSPSSSLGSIPEANGGIPPSTQETADESPTTIFQVMSSFTVPRGLLISPLHDSLLCLTRKEKLIPDNKLVPSVQVRQEHPVMLVDGAASIPIIDGTRKKMKLSGKNHGIIKLKHDKSMDAKNHSKLPFNKILENETPENKELMTNYMKRTPLSNSFCDVGDSAKVAGKAYEVSWEANKGGVRDRSFSAGSANEELLVSVSGHDSGKSKKKNCTSNSEHCIISADNIGLCPGSDHMCTDNQASTRFQSSCGVSKFKENIKVKVKHPLTEKIMAGATSHDQHKNKVHCRKKIEKKKESKGIHIYSKPAAVSAVVGMRIGEDASEKDKHTNYVESPSRSKMHKSQKDIIKVRDSYRDLLGCTDLKRTNDQIAPFGRVSDHNLKQNLDNARPEKPKKLLAFKSNSQLGAGTSVNNVPSTVPILENGITSGAVPVLDNWVCCDKCQKWRLLPYGMMPEDLPEKWLCSMLNWLSGMNHCYISEDETTKALNALYLPPVSEIQDNTKNHANGAAFGVTLAHDRDSHNSSRHVTSLPLKKKYATRVAHSSDIGGRIHISIGTKSHDQDSVKSRSLNDMSQPHGDTNLVKKYSFQQTNNLAMEKGLSKPKEMQHSGGVLKQIKIKHKKVTDQSESGTSKKIKTEGACVTDKYQKCDFDLEKGGRTPSTAFPIKAIGKPKLDHNQIASSQEMKFEVVDIRRVPVKKEGGEAQVPFNGVSVDARTCHKDRSLKKRKLKDWQENNKHEETFQCSGYQLTNVKDEKKESSENGLRKGKKPKVSKTVDEESRTNNWDDVLGKSNNVTTIIPSHGRDHLIGGMAEVRRTYENHELRKPKRKVASEQTVEVPGSLGRVLGPGQVSVAATSSSSKVSGSCKSRANFDEVKSSPVESISSSPLRTPKPDNRRLTAGNILQKVGGIDGTLPLVSNLRKSGDGEAVGETDGVGNTSTEKIYSKAKAASRIGKIRLVNNGDKVNVAYPVSDRGELVSKDRLGNESKFPTSCITKNSTDKKDHIGKKGYVVHCSDVNKKIDNQLISKDHGNSDMKLSSPGDKKHADQLNRVQNLGDELFVSLVPEEKADPVQIKSRGKSQILSRFREDKQRTKSESSRLVLGSDKEDTFDGASRNASYADDVLKRTEQPEKAADRNEAQNCLGHLTSGQYGDRVLNTSSRDASSENATNALKEAKELRQYADRLKGSGFVFESNEAYFQAALKFFGAASLLEKCNSEKIGEMKEMQLYGTAAELCKVCAYEYERRQEMTAAALAYKCMEVAYMRVVYHKQSSTFRDRCELQAALHMIPQGESPSSSASDVDNLNNQATVDKASLSKCAGSLIAGNHAVVARNGSSLIRLLDFMQDVNLAMEASSKSQDAFAAASRTLGEAQNQDRFISIKRVIDFSFQDVEGLIRLVRLAMETISHSGIGGPID